MHIATLTGSKIAVSAGIFSQMTIYRMPYLNLRSSAIYARVADY